MVHPPLSGVVAVVMSPTVVSSTRGSTGLSTKPSVGLSRRVSPLSLASTWWLPGTSHLVISSWRRTSACSAQLVRRRRRRCVWAVTTPVTATPALNVLPRSVVPPVSQTLPPLTARSAPLSPPSTSTTPTSPPSSPPSGSSSSASQIRRGSSPD